MHPKVSQTLCRKCALQRDGEAGALSFSKGNASEASLNNLIGAHTDYITQIAFSRNCSLINDWFGKENFEF